MSNSPRIVTIDALRPLLDRKAVIAAVRDALIWQAHGRVNSPMPGQLPFPEAPGDCHIKYGHVAGQGSFVIKIATGFYENARRGLPVNHGLMVVLDAQTGAPQTILLDDGWLTAWRTAAATVIAAAVLAPAGARCVGIIGTGLQATLAAQWIEETMPGIGVQMYGRDPRRTDAVAAELGVEAVYDCAELLRRCDVIITATPAAAALFDAEQVRPGTHLVGIGADSPGKQELPAALFEMASCMLVDDRAQCVDHGDFGNAVRTGCVSADAALLLGDVLAGDVAPARNPQDITIVDLTGIAAQDIAIAGLFSRLLASA